MKPTRSLLGIHVLMLLALTSTILIGGLPGRVASASDLAIYTDAFAAGWDPNWSYQNPVIDPNNAAPVHAGTKSIKVTYTAAFDGFSVHVPGGDGATLATAGYTGISFWVNGSAGNHQLSLFVQTTDDGPASSQYDFTAPAGVWSEITVPWSALDSPAAIARFTIQESTGATPTYFVDDIRLVGTTAGTGELPDATADRVLGQPGFTTRAPGGALDRMGKDQDNPGPAAIAIGPNGRLWVVDYGNSRVLSWPNAATADRQPADLVLDKGPGNNDFLGGPESIAVDGSGNVWVADSGNHRIVVYRTPVTTGMKASFAFGAYQEAAPDPPLRNLFNFPRGLAFDKANNLYLVDEFHDRLLIYNTPLTTDTTPDRQIAGIANPRGVAVDSQGNVFVTDSENDRVLAYRTPLTTDLVSDRTFGTTDDGKDCFTDSSTPSRTTLACPVDLTVDTAGNLYVSDIYNHRVVVYRDALASDTTPDAVYGQANYTSRSPNRGLAAPNATTLFNPLGLAVGSDGDLYIADFQNNRVLAYNAATVAPSDLVLSVNAASGRKTISPYIYGLHYTTKEFAAEIKLPVRRWGGNDTTRYNWLANISNNGYDYYFENNRNITSDLTADQFIQRDNDTGTRTLLTLPMIGWVAKDDDTACGFSVTKYNYTPKPYPDGKPAVDEFRTKCGSGITGFPNGTTAFYRPTDPKDTSIEAPPAFVQNWVQHLVTVRAQSSGQPLFYALDNEPDLWNSTHADVHPDPLSYDEFKQRTLAYAPAIRAADPNAKILGPVSFGWSGFFYSALDLSEAAKNGYTSYPDREAHGNIPFVAWYLQQMRASEQATKKRPIDYLDLHFYPQNGVDLRDAGDAAMQALRLRSTRALWDPTYRDESWIGGDDQPEDMRYVRLIPRMHAWVDANYPGTKLAITEYNWGGLEHINGALAQADILGIFGREGVDLATLFDSPFGDGSFKPNLPGAFAFRMYRNYDGKGSMFGDTSVQATSSAQDKLAVYAAQRGSSGALTVMVINKTNGTLRGKVNLAGFQSATNANVYRYSATKLTSIEHLAAQAVGSSGFTADFPANSITLFEIPRDPNAAAPHKVFVPMLWRQED